MRDMKTVCCQESKKVPDVPEPSDLDKAVLDLTLKCCFSVNGSVITHIFEKYAKTVFFECSLVEHFCQLFQIHARKCKPDF